MFKIDYQKIKKTKLYKQGGAIHIYYAYSPFEGVKDLIGPIYFYYGEKGFGNIYYDQAALAKVAYEYLNKQLKNKNFVDIQYKKWNLEKSKLFQFIGKIDKINLENLPDAKLLKMQKELSDANIRIWSLPIIIDIFDVEGEKIITKYVSKYHQLNLKPEEIKILLAPTEKMFVQKERGALLTIVDKLNRNSQIKKLFLNLKNTKDLEKIKNQRNIWRILTKHTNQYHFYKNDWAKVWDLDEYYFSLKIKSLLKDIKNVRKELKGLKENYKKLLISKKKLNKKIRARLRNVFYFFSKLTEWRDERKVMVQRVNHCLFQVIKEFSRRSGVKSTDLLYLMPIEIKNLKDLKKKIALINERKKGIAFIADKNKNYHWISGKITKNVQTAAEESMKIKTKEIRGSSVYGGKVQGLVKIIKTSDEFYKMKKGDILVAPMTRPEYLPIMKIASAIITDEGGITCHAAIVSRELKIPCIIGTQVATTVLSDGDRVEVDADKGIVKKL